MPIMSMREGLESISGGFSQPGWGPELSTIGAYSREGYTSRTFDQPIISFKDQTYYLERDEDVSLAINHLTSQITGGAHYWKSKTDAISEYMTNFSQKVLDFDWFDQLIVKECLYYGNSVFKPRLGIANIRNKDDLMHIPISSFVRIWWDRQRRPYKYEFRGPQYQGYHNRNDIIHFVWNPIDASSFGIGYGTALSAPKDFVAITPSGEVAKRLPCLLDLKYADQMVTHLASRRYMPRNVWVLAEGEQNDKERLENDLADLDDNEDVVATSALEVQELGSSQRAYDPSKYRDLIQGSIFKALNNMKGKQAGEAQHTYANAEQASVLDEIGLAGFPVNIIAQITQKIFKPWYEANQMYDMSYAGGMIGIPWDDCDSELNFGEVVKKDIEPEMLVKLLEIGLQSGAVNDPIEIRDLLERAGLPLSKEYKDMLNQMYNNYGAVPQDFNQQGQMPVQMNQNMSYYYPYQNNFDFDTKQADQQPRPMDSPWYTAEPAAYLPPGIDPQPSDARLNFTLPDKIPKQVPGRIAKNEKRVKLPDKLSITDINEFLADHGSET